MIFIKQKSRSKKNIMSSTPLVSAIVPCYNHGRFIGETIRSIQCQTFAAIEIIVVDDGSTDAETRQVLENIKEMGILVIRQENSKTAVARNTGFNHASGDYLLTVDADDLIAPTFVEKAMSVLERYPKIGAVSSWVRCFGSQNYNWMPTGGGVQNFVLDINCSSFALIRRALWSNNGGFDSGMVNGYEDWEFWVNATKKGWIIHILKEFLFFYRHRFATRAGEAIANRTAILRYMSSKHPEVFLGKSIGR